ncbi:hypothetical protein [Acinetobacter pittii]|uniref:hypothetical protein n=1 Tax=Acinetobacter pittii TaxID=48296 RepID=UPI0024DE60BA|nr:hypothetical protein [Acinetobacter pittii]
MGFFLVILIILIFTFQIVLYYSTFRNFDFGWNVFSGLADKTWNVNQSGNIIDDGLESKWGTFGDFMGGVLNPILGFITIILLLISHEKDSKRAEKHEEQREIDLFITRLQYLKSIQQDHVKGLNLIKLDEKGNVSYIPQDNFFFTILLNALSLTMKTARENNNLSSLRQEDLLTVCVWGYYSMVIISIIGNLYRKIIFILIIKLILFHLYESLKEIYKHFGIMNSCQD